jgi:sulfatase modifying factor 1
MTNCGAASESCCTSLEVAGGTFYRTYTNSGTGPTGKANQASLSGFRLDKYLVTVGRFRQFANAVLPPDGGTGWMPAAGSGKHTHLNGGKGLANSARPGTYEPGWVASDNSNIAPTNANLACNSVYAYHTWTDTAGSQESLPINCVTWQEAYAFCIWDGGFLPSEAEWEYAAAGGSQQREYPWGSTAPGTANQYAIYADDLGHCYYPSHGTCTGVANIAPVGTATMGAGLWGQLDLAGNMYQRNLDWYANSYVDPCADCAYLTAAGRFPATVVRGGSFDSPEGDLLPPSRSNSVPKSDAFGLRCARTP